MMKKLPVCIIVVIILINIFLHLKASNTCMDTSWHLEKRFDYKEYHKVSCNCPCWKYKELADRNRCSKCLHFHKPEPYGVRKPNYIVHALRKKMNDTRVKQRKAMHTAQKEIKKPQDLFGRTGNK